ncbi:hypothetical protein CPB83DRAFT_865240 [Crepidotus variabilis]|uniref:CFEM domain-containing protein n=1 Tax=Crepidotus variabilis TaxID=179855 RepID=A0A9P6JI61_9AGAR|nr:hypothetical protein CPB83DRAFT_865240 [Crepidotus variabilis]
MFSKIFVILAITAATVNAQSSSATTPVPSTVAGVSPCILGCVLPAAAQNGCTSVLDTACICGSAQFQADAAQCLATNCPNDVDSALQLQKAQCASASVTPTGSATPRPVSFSSSPSTPTASGSASGSGSHTSSGAPSATSSGAASMVEGSVVGVLGAIIAGAFVL